jgi:hypothetical protein
MYACRSNHQCKVRARQIAAWVQKMPGWEDAANIPASKTNKGAMTTQLDGHSCGCWLLHFARQDLGFFEALDVQGSKVAVNRLCSGLYHRQYNVALVLAAEQEEAKKAAAVQAVEEAMQAAAVQAVEEAMQGAAALPPLPPPPGGPPGAGAVGPAEQEEAAQAAAVQAVEEAMQGAAALPPLPPPPGGPPGAGAVGPPAEVEVSLSAEDAPWLWRLPEQHVQDNASDGH